MIFLCTFVAKVPKRGDFDFPAPLHGSRLSQSKALELCIWALLPKLKFGQCSNDKGSALNPFLGVSLFCGLKICSYYQIQNLHAVVIHELIVLTTKIIVQQRKLITKILPLILDFSFVLWHRVAIRSIYAVK